MEHRIQDAEQVVQRAFNPSICVFNTPDVDNFVKNMQHESLLSLLQYAPAPESVTVRNTRQMSAKLTDMRPNFVSIPIYGKFPGIEDANVMLERILGQDAHQGRGTQESPSNSYLEWLTSILKSTTDTPSAFETWSHPVAAICAINAGTPDPLGALQRLHDESYEHFGSLPFVNAEFLRFFLVVHDEGSNWDETVALFEHVKRKFGPHSGILRLGSSQDRQNTDNCSVLIRDLMNQSVIPFMEECCSVWYEQIAASKQGFAGRLLSVGRRYLTSSSRLGNTNILESVARKSQRFLASPFANQPLRNNYHTDGGYYHWSAPQAQLRKIADFAVILRDYKFASGIYEMLRKEYHSERAWGYAASGQEMSCITSLLIASAPLSKDSVIDSLLDSSFYTYISRCQLPLWALRCILTVTELLKALPIDPTLSAMNHYATVWGIKWLTKVLAEQLATPLSYPVVCERIASTYQAFNVRKGPLVCGRERKASFWLLLASREWAQSGYQQESQRCFSQCQGTYQGKEYEQEPLFRGLAEKLHRIGAQLEPIQN